MYVLWSWSSLSTIKNQCCIIYICSMILRSVYVLYILVCSTLQFICFVLCIWVNQFFFYVFCSLFWFSHIRQLPSQDILTLLEFMKGVEHDSIGFFLEYWNEESINFNDCLSSLNGIIGNGGNVVAPVLDNLGLFVFVNLTVFANLPMLVKLAK